MRNGIVLAGTVILDIVHLIDRWPPEEQMARVERSVMGAGGPPFNAGAGLKKLGAKFPVSVLGVVGDDTYGDELLRQAVEQELDVSGIVRLADTTTSNTQVMTVRSTGRRTFFHNVGANAKLSEAHLSPKSGEARIFYLGSPGIAPAMDEGSGWLSILNQARAMGFTTALELVPVSSGDLGKLVRPLLPYTDIFIVNDSEAEITSGIPVESDGDLSVSACEKACRTLLTMGVGKLVAIHHPNGAFAMTTDGKTSVAGSVKVPANEIIGSVGAGDAFYAGMLYGIHEGWALDQSLALANAAAATSLHSPTTTASIRDATSCLDYANQNGLRTLAD